MPNHGNEAWIFAALRTVWPHKTIREVLTAFEAVQKKPSKFYRYFSEIFSGT